MMIIAKIISVQGNSIEYSLLFTRQQRQLSSGIGVLSVAIIVSIDI
jgi:hypothetical protein